MINVSPYKYFWKCNTNKKWIWKCKKGIKWKSKDFFKSLTYTYLLSYVCILVIEYAFELQLNGMKNSHFISQTRWRLKRVGENVCLGKNWSFPWLTKILTQWKIRIIILEIFHETYEVRLEFLKTLWIWNGAYISSLIVLPQWSGNLRHFRYIPIRDVIRERAWVTGHKDFK